MDRRNDTGLIGCEYRSVAVSACVFTFYFVKVWGRWHGRGLRLRYGGDIGIYIRYEHYD